MIAQAVPAATSRQVVRDVVMLPHQIAAPVKATSLRRPNVLEHVPPELNRQDSHGVLDRRFYRH
jgi:hypothetical protein